MRTIRNKVQLIGNVGNSPETKTLENSKKVASFSLATNEFYRNSQGDKVEQTQWHQIICWGNTAEIVEKYVAKGREIAVEGKLSNRSYEISDGSKRYISEIIASEILLLGSSSSKA
jgi:single-strand DNA-binding protein